MIGKLITESQKGNSNATLLVIKKFEPLLRKYAYKLYYEDAYHDLLADFIELIQKIKPELTHDKSEGKMVTYISKSIKNSYLKKITILKKHQKIILFSESSENQLYYISVLSSANDEYFTDDLPYISSFLTETEYSVIKMIYCHCYTASETASFFNISRQAVNQTKKRALQKLMIMYSDNRDMEAIS